MGIVQVRMWQDVGMTESSAEKPKIGAKLPSPDFVSGEARFPSKNEIFSAVEIKEDYVSMMNMSYIEVTYDFNSDTKVFFGWIDSIIMKSDSDDFPLTRINWHVDLWRTYSQAAEFKAGFVVKAPSSPYPQAYRMIKWLSQPLEETIELFPQKYGGYRVWWAFILYTEETDSHEVTSTEVFCFPFKGPYRNVAPLDSKNLWIKDSIAGEAKLAPSFGNVLSGTWDETLGLTPSRVKAVFVSPIGPSDYSGNGSAKTVPIQLNNTSWFIERKSDDKKWYFRLSLNMQTETDKSMYDETTITLDESIESSDTEKFCVTDFDGMPIGELPWGVEITELTYRIIQTTSSMYIQIRARGRLSSCDALAFSIPLIPLELTSNSWSEYNYSGQRDYDIQMRNIQANKALIEGVTGGFVNGGIAGGMQYAMAGEKAAKNALLKSTGAGLAAGTVGSLVGYGLEMGVFAPQIQAAKDTLEARQSDPLILPGGGFDCFYYGPGCRIVKMVPDSASLAKRSMTIRQYGADVNAAYENCTSLINRGGPLQIVNLNVCGRIPVEAKNLMKNMFAGGVRLT